MTTLAYKQINFFDKVTGEEITDNIGIVYKLPNGNWQAELCGGWYVAIRGNKDSAIKAVKKMYKEETEKMW